MRGPIHTNKTKLVQLLQVQRSAAHKATVTSQARHPPLVPRRWCLRELICLLDSTEPLTGRLWHADRNWRVRLLSRRPWYADRNWKVRLRRPFLHCCHRLFLESLASTGIRPKDRLRACLLQVVCKPRTSLQRSVTCGALVV